MALGAPKAAGNLVSQRQQGRVVGWPVSSLLTNSLRRDTWGKASPGAMYRHFCLIYVAVGGAE